MNRPDAGGVAPAWTDVERRIIGGALQQHLDDGTTRPFGLYDPTENGSLLEAELVARGYAVDTSLYPPGSPEASAHECSIECPDGTRVSARAPNYDQAVAQAALWALGGVRTGGS